MSKILTFEEAEEQGLRRYSYDGLYDSKYYKYKTEDGYWHLIRGGVDLISDKKAVDLISDEKAVGFSKYDNDDRSYSYQTEDGYWHLIRDKKAVDLLEGKKAIDFFPEWSEYGDIYLYQTEDGYWHMIVNDTDMLDGQGVIDYYKYDNCDYRFQTESGIWYSILDQDIGYEMVGEHSVI